MEGRQPWLSSVSYWGFIDEGKAIAGLFGEGYPILYDLGGGYGRWVPELTDCCEGVQVYRNDSVVDMEICCKAWKSACKPPTGRSAVSPFFIADTLAFAIVTQPQ